MARRRWSRSLALVVGVTGLGALALVGESHAELENQVFTSRADRLRIVVPRGWRATDQPSYVLTSEAFTRDLYCSWPVTCRTSSDSLAGKFACALKAKLQSQRMHVAHVQPGPRENLAAGLPSVWFDYDDGRRYLRQAVAIGNDRAVSLILAAPSAEARATHVRSFEQALRTLRALTAEESTPAVAAADTPTTTDAATASAQPFESAPAPRVEPVGPCPARR
jgi:hypothetical protein